MYNSLSFLSRFEEYPVGHGLHPNELSSLLKWLNSRIQSSENGGSRIGGEEKQSINLQLPTALKLPINSSVKIQNLKSKPHLNSQIGEIVGVVPNKNRYSVLINGENLALKLDNLLIVGNNVKRGDGEVQVDVDVNGDLISSSNSERVADHSKLPNTYWKVRNLKSLKAKPYNGCLARIQTFDSGSGRYVCDLGNGLTLKVKSENLTL